MRTDNEKYLVFRHEITVRWADCDPAQIAYTGRLPYFALEAIESWWKAHFDFGWYEVNIDKGNGLPFVHLSMDFRSPVTPRHPLICEVRLLKLGETSVRFEVKGFQNETLCFEGAFVEVLVSSDDFSKKQFPENIRVKLADLCVG